MAQPLKPGRSTIRSYFAAVNAGGKTRPPRHQSPPAAADGAHADGCPDGCPPAAAAAPETAVRQFQRKRKRAADDAAALQQAGDGGAAAGLRRGEEGPGPGRRQSGIRAAAAAPRQLTQLHLDAGQQDFHSCRCPTCGMLYCRGAEADELLHAAFHAAATSGPRYQGWPGERVLEGGGSGRRLLLCRSGDGDRPRKSLLELCTFLEAQMGLPGGWLLRTPLTWLLLVSASRRIQAVVAAEAIRDAFPVRPSRQPLAAQQHAHSCQSAVAAGSDGGQPGPAAAAAAAADLSLRSATHSSGPCPVATAECGAAAEQGQATAPPSPPPAAASRLPTAAAAPTASPRRQQPGLQLDRRVRVRAALGVRLMWVSLEERRRGLAGRLLDAARSHVLAGYVPPRHELAFSAPTDAGRAFIQAYTGTAAFLVYE